jgi:hypothetical protein
MSVRRAIDASDHFPFYVLCENMNPKIQDILLVLCVFVLAAQSHAESQRPNIVVFLADDMGWGDAGCYGNEKIVSPNIDKSASQGVRFTQCYAACGVCSPSRSAILTGRTPYRNGVWQHLSGGGETHLRISEITYPKLLQQAGYETCHVGKWHLNSKTSLTIPSTLNRATMATTTGWRRITMQVPAIRTRITLSATGSPLAG